MSWWSNKPTFITRSWEFFQEDLLTFGQLIMMYYYRLYELDILLIVLSQTLCKVEIFFEKFLKSLKTVATTRVLLFQSAWFWFWYTFTLKSPRMYNSFLRVSNLAKFSFRVCRKLYSRQPSSLFLFLSQRSI